MDFMKQTHLKIGVWDSICHLKCFINPHVVRFYFVKWPDEGHQPGRKDQLGMTCLILRLPGCFWPWKTRTQCSLGDVLRNARGIWIPKLIWLVVWNMFLFFHILGIIIPTDELVFFRGVGIPPTSNDQTYSRYHGFQPPKDAHPSPYWVVNHV